MSTPPKPANIKNLKDWRFEIDFEGLAWAVFDREGEAMNTLGRRPGEELAGIVEAVEGAAKKGEVKGFILISAKASNFIAGADIREFDQLSSVSKVEEAVGATKELFNRIEHLPVPVIAAIHGFCLGGGLELAMACQYRIATRAEGTRIGLPEVRLGIFPGLNGTVRSLRLAGAIDAMQMMLTGRMLHPAAARAIGLVDELVADRGMLRWAARKAALQNRRSKGAPLWKKLLLVKPIRGLLANRMRQQTSKKAREEHYPAPFRLIDLFEEYGGDQDRMAAAETRAFAPLMVSETARNLRRVFRLTEKLKDETTGNGFAPLRIHVIGAGTMGGDIAAWCVLSGLEVSLQDLSLEQIEPALSRARKLFKRRLKRPQEAETAMTRLIPDPLGAHISRADMVIEAIVERLEIKRKVFTEIEPKLKDGAVLATNTSSINIEEIAKSLKDPGRLIGLHFFNPVDKLPLVEVVRGEQSRAEEVGKGCAFVKAINKYPLVVKSGPGFLVNRVLAPYMMAAMKRYQSGEPRDKIDEAALKFGMPMGPLELSDVVGLDVCQHVAEILGLAPAEGNELERMVKAGKLGKKSGEGFYRWQEGKPQREQTDYGGKELAALGRELVEPLLDECEKCLQEGVVESADHVDAGVIFGTGFAPFRGGPLHYRASLKAGERSADDGAEVANS